MSGRAVGVLFSFVLHATLIGAAVFFSARARSADVTADSDPLLVLLADEDADPTKSAGLVGEQRGLAQGSPDGDTLKETDGADSEPEDSFAFSGELGNLPEPPPPPPPPPETPPPAPTPATPEPAEPVPATSRPSQEKPKPAAAVPAETKPKPATSGARNPKPEDSGPKKISFSDWKKNSGGNTKKNPGANARNSSGGKKANGGKTPAIDVGKIGIGGGGGKRVGTPDGVGGNGGDGGRAVASAQQIYARDVAEKLMKHLDDVLMQAPLTLDGTLVVSVRLGVDARGNISFLEVLESSDPQVRDRVRKAVERIGRFRAPPEGRAFEMRIPDVALRPL